MSNLITIAFLFIDDPLTVLFAPNTVKYIDDRLLDLNLPEQLDSFVGLGLQKDSEFTQLFNYQIVKVTGKIALLRMYCRSMLI